MLKSQLILRNVTSIATKIITDSNNNSNDIIINWRTALTNNNQPNNVNITQKI
jgi:hypothetical protein